MIGIGFIVANWVGYGCQYLPGDQGWRLSLGLQLVPAALLLIGIQFLPFSPRWLLEKGRDEEARKVVYQLSGVKTPAAKAIAEAQFQEMSTSIKAEMVGRSRRLSDLWATRAMLKRTGIAVGVQVMGQFTGVNGTSRRLCLFPCDLFAHFVRIVINYFGPSMYKALGLSSGQTLLVQGIYGAVGPIANILYVFSRTPCLHG